MRLTTQSPDGPFQTTLDNGLRILVQTMRTAPVASFWIWYRVGTRNEHQGITGISHWVEHMLFKGTERWPARAADQQISREGGLFNGLTWYDFTTFYETLPAGKLALALDIESDRICNARFSEADVESERTVILSERQGAENSPLFLLSEEVTSAAYRVHPYGHETIGHRCDLEAITHDDLQRHRDTYHAPNNAIVAVAGDVSAEEVTVEIERAFGGIPRADDPPPVRSIEPPQRGERRVVVEGAGQTDYCDLAYHIPAATHPDFHPLTVLNAILTGGSGFLVGRGHITNHTSRLYRALVEEEKAVDIDGRLTPTIDPGLYRLSATLWPDGDPETVESQIEREITRLRDEPVSESELEKARCQARALFAYSSESISNQAFWLGFSSIFADTTWFAAYLDCIEAVTAADVQRVAQTYLVPTNRTTGWYLSHGHSE
jgi:zinc protease